MSNRTYNSLNGLPDFRNFSTGEPSEGRGINYNFSDLTAHIGNENVVFFDVDETLIMWKGVDWTPNQANINALIREHKRGKFIIVWSRAGGYAAAIAVQQLKLNQYVGLTMAKPNRIIDDKDPSEWMEVSYYKEGEEND